MEDWLEQIRYADGRELSLIVRQVIDRYAELFPDDEVIFLSLPKNSPAERGEVIQQFLRMADIAFFNDF